MAERAGSNQGTVRMLFQHRRLIYLMTRQDMKTQYGEYKFGILWTLAEPLLLAAMMFLVFAFVLGGSRGIALEPFIVYIITGMLPFAWLSSSINRSPTTFRKYGRMLTFSNLPVLIWPLRSVTVGMVELFLSIPVIVVAVYAFGAHLTWGALLFPVGMLLQLILCLGLAFIGSSLAVSFPDTKKLAGLLARMLFWASPILWQARDFPDWLQPLLYLNPFHGILDLYRAAVWPDEVLAPLSSYAMSIAVILALFIAGLIGLRIKANEIRRLG